MTWSSRVRVESQEWSSHFESYVYNLESMSSHTNFKLFLYIFGYRSTSGNVQPIGLYQNEMHLIMVRVKLKTICTVDVNVHAELP